MSFIADVAPICTCFTKKNENEAVKSLWKLRIGAVVSLSFYAEKVKDHSVAKFVGQEKDEEIKKMQFMLQQMQAKLHAAATDTQVWL